jgi:hypothetical protein
MWIPDAVIVLDTVISDRAAVSIGALSRFDRDVLAHRHHPASSNAPRRDLAYTDPVARRIVAAPALA